MLTGGGTVEDRLLRPLIFALLNRDRLELLRRFALRFLLNELGPGEDRRLLRPGPLSTRRTGALQMMFLDWKIQLHELIITSFNTKLNLYLTHYLPNIEK